MPAQFRSLGKGQPIFDLRDIIYANIKNGSTIHDNEIVGYSNSQGKCITLFKSDERSDVEVAMDTLAKEMDAVYLSKESLYVDGKYVCSK